MKGTTHQVSTPVTANHTAMAEQTTFGFTRTICACHDCIISCHFIPGYLIPEDIPVMAAHLGYTDHTAFARAHLLASPGATVLKDGVPYQIPTLVPQRREGGACQFLDAQNRCVIHASAPFGCRMFDSHQTHEEANRRSVQGLLAIARDWTTGGAYSRLWQMLAAEGRLAPPPSILRARMQAAFGNGS